MTGSSTQQNESYSVKRVAILFTRFKSIWGYKWKEHVDDVSIEIATEEWVEGLRNIPDRAIKEALAHCRNNFKWPPSIAEFRELCDRFCGIPDYMEALRLAQKGDFSSSAVKLAYDRFGGYEFRMMLESDINRKWKHVYESALNEIKNQECRHYGKIENSDRTGNILGEQNLLSPERDLPSGR